MKLKITELQKHRISNALYESSEVLREIKQKVLKDEALSDMKILEQAVQHLESFLVGK